MSNRPIKIPTRLEELSREELVHLCRTKGFYFKKDLAWARYEVMNEKALRISDDALLEMKKNHGLENIARWEAASRKFDNAQKLWLRVQEFLKAAREHFAR